MDKNPAPAPPPCRVFTFKNFLWLTFFLVLTGAARCANYRSVFVTSAAGAMRQTYFVDGDCYARMTRVREVLQRGGLVHYHPWENFPKGVWPHTTAPMDYLIAGLALLLKPFMADYIDMAGAIVSPLLGLMTTGFLALWARELSQQYRRLMLLLASLSPILVHGTCLGRPDHQSLQIFLIAVSLGAEIVMAQAPTIVWSIVGGAAWGLGLWVSLYEPLVLMVVVFLTTVIFYRQKLFVKVRWWELGAIAFVLGIAWLLEGPYIVKSFAIEAGDPALKQYFGNWSATIAEMTHTTVLSALIYEWVGWGLIVAPLLLIARLRDTKRSLMLLTLLIATFAFTLKEIRWGYFFALIYTMSLPWQLSLFKWKWLVWPLFILSLWPIGWGWEMRLFPDEAHETLRIARLDDQRRLRQAAEYIRDHAPGGILAPWWWSPQLAYWSGQPALAGSSHESLSGIVDTSRFFVTTDPKAAERICNDRQVETIFIGDPSDIVDQSAKILGQPFPQKENTMADILYQKPHSAPIFLHIVFDNIVIKVFEVNHGFIVR